DAGVPYTPQERDVVGVGINFERHTQCQGGAGKACDCEPRHHGARKSGGGSAALGGRFSLGGRRRTLRDLSLKHDRPISTSESGAPENAGLRVGGRASPERSGNRHLPAQRQYQRLTELLTGTEEIKDIEMEWQRQEGTPITVRCSGRRINDENC